MKLLLSGVLASLVAAGHAARLRTPSGRANAQLVAQAAGAPRRLLEVSVRLGSAGLSHNGSSTAQTRGARATTYSHSPTPADYKLCGSTMNQAWKSFKESPCSHLAHEALLAMRNAADTCAKLRYAEEYRASYKELLEKTDLYCGSRVECGGCGHGKCQRQENFPYDPKCVCEPDWTGRVCSERVCKPGCTRHGKCHDGSCICDRGWRGNTCGEAICQRVCENGGECVGPNTCGCSKGWRGVSCSEPVCAGGCANGGRCVGPDTCECVSRRSVSVNAPDGSQRITTQEGFHGLNCSEGPEFFFGDLCRDCVEEGNSWCLKDGLCFESGNEALAAEECPQSTKKPFEGFTPLLVKGHQSPCNAHYRECAEVASILVHMLNDEYTKIPGGACSAAAADAILAAQKERGRCEGITVVALKRRIGTLKVVESFDSIVRRAGKKHASCKTKLD